MTLPNFRDCDKAPLEKVAKYVRGDTNFTNNTSRYIWSRRYFIL